jgi:hypothetical protein
VAGSGEGEMVIFLCSGVCLLIGGTVVFLLFNNFIIDGKNATIERITIEKDAALQDAERQKPELASLRGQKEQLEQKNLALKNSGAFIPEKLFLNHAYPAPNGGMDAAGKYHFQSYDVIVSLNILNGVPYQPITLEISVNPEDALLRS